jgi:hypothetical protein
MYLMLLALVQPRYEDHVFYGYGAGPADWRAGMGDAVEILLERESGGSPPLPFLRDVRFVSSQLPPRGPRSRTGWDPVRTRSRRGSQPFMLTLEMTPRQAHELDLVLQADAGWAIVFRVSKRGKPPKEPLRYH